MSTFDYKAFLQTLTTRPGVYQMYDGERRLLYVGKAKNLKNRMSSYFRINGLSTKTMILVSKITDIQVTVTTTELDALLLEQNLIKQYRPPYNITLKDDKSYPYIYLSSCDRWPRLSLHRGAKRRKGEYFGPYPSASAVRSTIQLLQKVLKVRQCEDSYFRNRSRPCLQYQIGRCTGPCVGLVSDECYTEQVEKAIMFLKGKSQVLMNRLADEMEAASAELRFEDASERRDQLKYLQQVQSIQSIEGVRGDLDIIVAVANRGSACVQVLFVREARVLGSRTYYPPTKLDEGSAIVLEAFLSQFYLSDKRAIPATIIVNELPEGVDVLAEALSIQAGYKVDIRYRVRDARARWLQLAKQTAENNLRAHLSDKQSMAGRLNSLRYELDLEALPTRMECFDISHSSGEATVGSCVVFDTSGPRKVDYRQFNIEGIIGGDDYAAMQQVLKRRYMRLSDGEGQLPSVLFVDGGKGQVAQAIDVLASLGIDSVRVVGIAKGTTRKAGFETLIDGDSGQELVLRSDVPALHLIQQIRDEAHRFAITGHRARRSKARKTSSLERIPGVGAKRRRELLRHFGSAGGVENAGVQELCKVENIGSALAKTIYDHLHSAYD